MEMVKLKTKELEYKAKKISVLDLRGVAHMREQVSIANIDEKSKEWLYTRLDNRLTVLRAREVEMVVDGDIDGSDQWGS